MAEKLNFTKKVLDDLPAPAKGRAYYLDTKQTSLGLTITDRGTRSFHVRATVNGTTKRIAIKNGKYPAMTVEQARTQAKKLLADIANDVNPIQKRQKKKALTVTLQQVFDSYLSERDLKPGTIKDYKLSMKESFDEWMDKPLKNITDRMVQARYQQRGKASKARADNAIRVLGAVYRYAQAKYRDSEGSTLFLRNPVDILKETKTRFKIPRKKRVVPRESLDKWFNAVDGLNNKVASDYLLFLLFTGTRREEAAKLTWEEVNFTANTFRLLDTKNREVVTLPLPDFIGKRLKVRRGRKRTLGISRALGKAGYLSDPRKSIEIVKASTKIPFSPHDLRRTYISIAESLDMSVYTIKALVNHKMSGDVTAGYVVQTPERLAKASNPHRAGNTQACGLNKGGK